VARFGIDGAGVGTIHGCTASRSPIRKLDNMADDHKVQDIARQELEEQKADREHVSALCVTFYEIYNASALCVPSYD
jgi:hypothetical protein